MGRSRRWILLTALALANLAVGLVLLASVGGRDQPDSGSLLTAYQRAIDDAQWLAEGGRTRRLFPLRADNEKLEWVDVGDERWLRVLVWMSRRDFNQRFAAAQATGSAVEIRDDYFWVTLVPQVREFCALLPREQDPAHRLKQYLGLNPDDRLELMVELAVDPARLFRPCFDPEVEDDRCETVPDRRSPVRVPGIDDYARWMDDMQRIAYRPDGFPWTRLGYRYDWRYPRAGVGASEYVIAPGSRVEVLGALSTDRYCGYDAPPESRSAESSS